jgi:hypothetical protein
LSKSEGEDEDGGGLQKNHAIMGTRSLMGQGGWSEFMLKKLAFTQEGVIISMSHECPHFLASRFRSEGEIHLSKVAT